MGATKIINVLKDDKFEELLDIVKETDASEVIFVLPKTTKAFKTEAQFAALEKEIQNGNKSVAFMCSNHEVNDMAKKYNFDVLSSKSDSKPKAQPKVVPILSPLEKQNRGSSISQLRNGGGEIGTVPVAVKNKGADEEEDNELEDEFGEHYPPFGKEPEEPEEVAESIEEEEETKEEGEDYKEGEAEPEIIEEDAPYGTELDESGEPIYEEEEEELEARRFVPPQKYLSATVASAKTRGMSDVVRPSDGKHVKVIQKDKRPVKLETHTEPADDIQSVWGRESSGNIWADISKPQITGKYKPKRGLNFNFGNFSRRRVVVLSAASIPILIGFVIFLTVGSARIEIRPRSQALDTQLKVTMSPNFPSVDNSFNRIPGQLFIINKTASGEFNATSEKDAVQKARGTITIYNEYSTSPQPLVTTTRLEYLKDGISSGLVFRTLQTITVPGMKVENGVVTPGKIDVEVIADKAGQAYNVPHGEFGIVAWRERGDTARYEKIYGRSADSMHGGILGKAKVVSEFDYNNAKDNLTAKVVNDINQALKTQSAGLELLAKVEPKIDSIESTAKIDDAANTFTMTVSGSIMTIGYKKDDLMTLLAGHIEKINGLMIVPDKIELSYKDIVINPANKTLEAVITIGGNAYAKIDRDAITANLMGKNELQIKDYLSSIKDIDSAKVILSPFWVKKIPKNEDKIDISLTF